MEKMYTKNGCNLSRNNLNLLFFIFWGCLLGLLLDWTNFSFNGVLLSFVIFSIPLILINPKIGFILFIISLGLNSNDVSLKIGFHLKYAYLFFLLTLMSWLLHKFNRQKNIVFIKTAISIPLFTFLFITIISIFQSAYIPDPTLVLYYAFRNYPWIKSLTRVLLLILMFAIFYFTIYFIKDMKILKQTINILLISIIFICLIGMYGFIGGFTEIPSFSFKLTSGYNNELPRVHSFSQEPLFLGNYLLVFFPFFILLFWSKKYIWNKKFHLTALLLILLTIILTFSRSVWLALLFMVALISIFKRKTLFQSRYLKIICLILLCLILFSPTIMPYLIKPIQKFIIWPVQGIFDASSGKFWSTRLRLTAADLALKGFKNHPFLGIGLQNFNFHSGMVEFFGLFDYRTEWNLETINNLPLKILVELGILGFIITSWLVLRIIKFCYFSLKTISPDSFLYDIILGGLISFIIFIVNSISFSTLTFPYFWFALGITFAAINLSKQNVKQINLS